MINELIQTKNQLESQINGLKGLVSALPSTSLSQSPVPLAHMSSEPSLFNKQSILNQQDLA